MAPKVALILCFCCVLALLIQDVRWRPKISIGGWIPLLWMLVVGSRSVSSWFDSSMQVEGADVYLEGSPVDRAFYMVMIFAGIVVLIARHVSWSKFLAQNKWLALYFAFFGISVLWSDYTFISFKRWIKDFGNVVMVLIVLSEQQPVAAIKALLVRCSYFLIPLSVVLVKYFPDLARSYNRWTGVGYYSGVTTDKNLLGMVLTTMGISVLWALFGLRDEPPRSGKTLEALVYMIIVAMTVWLLMMANSATALVTSTLGLAILILFRFKTVRNHGWTWIGVGVVGATVLFAAGIWSQIQDSLIGALGRDPSLTGRSDIWEAVLGEHTNPLIGVGFYSFWMGDRVERLSASYHYALNEAHNGYLEVYLNGGLIGLALLGLLLWSAVARSLSRLTRVDEGGIETLRLAFLVTAIVYGLTEAIFSRLDLIWFGLLLVVSIAPNGREESLRGARSPTMDRLLRKPSAL